MRRAKYSMGGPGTKNRINKTRPTPLPTEAEVEGEGGGKHQNARTTGLGAGVGVGVGSLGARATMDTENIPRTRTDVRRR